MAAVFWDRKGMLMVEFMQKGTTIMSEAYCVTLKELHRTVQNKRLGMLSSSVVLLHDSAHQHTAARTQALLEHLNWEFFDNPPNSPDISSSNDHLFTYLKNLLQSQHFSNNEELMEGVKTWLNSQVVDFFDTGIQKYIPQYDKCLNSGVTMLRRSLSMYFVCNKILFTCCLFC
jgi:hypothetical protein